MSLSVGIDWGKDHHDVAVMDRDGTVLAIRQIDTGLEGFTTILRLVSEHGGSPEITPVGIETDKDSTYTANSFTTLYHHLGIRQSMGRVRSCFNNPAAKAFFNSLESEIPSHHEFTSTRQTQTIVLDRCYGSYNHDHHHSAAGMISPINHETTADTNHKAAQRYPPRSRGNHKGQSHR